MMKIIGTDIRQRFSDYISSGKRVDKDDEVNAATAGSSNRTGDVQEEAQAQSLLSDSQSMTPGGPSQPTVKQSQPVQLSQPFDRTSQSEDQNLKSDSWKTIYSNLNNAFPTKVSDMQNGNGSDANGLPPGVEQVTSSFVAATTGGALSTAAAKAFSGAAGGVIGGFAGSVVVGIGDPGLGFGLGGAATGAGGIGMGYGSAMTRKWTILNNNAEGNKVLNNKHVFTEDDARAEVEDMAHHLGADRPSLVEEEEECVIIDGLRLDKK